MWLGDFIVGQTVTCRFYTVDASGAPVTLAGSPTARVRRGSGAGTTITTGVTLTVDVMTGQHCVDVDTTSGYIAAADYSIEISAGTVSGVSVVGLIVGKFSIANRAVAPQTGDSFARIGAAGAGLTALGDTRIANLDATMSSRTKPADTQARVTLVDTVTTLTNAPSDSSGVTTLLSRLSALRAGYLDNLSAGAAALESSLQALITTVGAAGAGLTATATAVWAVATRLLTAGTNIVLAKGVGVTGFNDLSAAQVNAEADIAIVDAGLSTAANLATVAGYLDTEISAILTDTNELQTDWANGGRLDLILDSAASAGDPWATAIPGAYGAGTAGKIVGDNLNATVGSRASQTSVDDLPTNAELATALAAADDAVLAAIAALNNLSQAGVRTAVGLASANLDTQLAALAAYVDTEIAAIKAKTDNLPADPADASDIAAAIASLASTLATIAAYIDTEVAAIKAKTDNLPAAPAATGDIPTAAAIADAVYDEDGGKLRAHLPSVLKVVVGVGSTTTTIVLNSSTGIDGAAPSSVNDFFNGCVLVLTSGALAGQRTSVSDYDGTTKTLTVVALTGAPAAAVTGILV